MSRILSTHTTNTLWYTYLLHHIMKQRKNPHIKRRENYTKKLAQSVAVFAVRNTVIEDYHSGISPKSKTGDYSDIKVVTPYGEIPWNVVSRISDEEMKAFNQEVANKIYTSLHYLNEPYTDEGKIEFFKHLDFVLPKNWG